MALPQDVVDLSEKSDCVFVYHTHLQFCVISDVTLLTLLHSLMILQYVARTSIAGTHLHVITSYLHLLEVLLPSHK